MPFRGFSSLVHVRTASLIRCWLERFCWCCVVLRVDIAQRSLSTPFFMSRESWSDMILLKEVYHDIAGLENGQFSILTAFFCRIQDRVVQIIGRVDFLPPEFGHALIMGMQKIYVVCRHAHDFAEVSASQRLTHPAYCFALLAPGSNIFGERR